MKTTNILRSATEGPVTLYLIEFNEERAAFDKPARFMATWARAGTDITEVLPGYSCRVTRSEFYKVPDNPWQDALKCKPWGEHNTKGYYPLLVRQQAEHRYMELVLAARSGKTKFEVKE
ncbi:MAG: hypothetical protein AAGU19_07945 [Prolixibacteraceae bacterium]